MTRINESQLRKIIREELIKETTPQASNIKFMPVDFDDFKDRMFVALSKAGVSHQRLNSYDMYDMWVNDIEKAWRRLQFATINYTELHDEWWELCTASLENYLNPKTAERVADHLCNPNLPDSPEKKDAPIFDLLSTVTTSIVSNYEDIPRFQIKLYRERGMSGKEMETLLLVYTTLSGMKLDGAIEMYELKRVHGIPFTTLKELYEWMISHGAKKMTSRRRKSEPLDDYT